MTFGEGGRGEDNRKFYDTAFRGYWDMPTILDVVVYPQVSEIIPA